jgi:uncharacterized protein (TIGR02266 family)
MSDNERRQYKRIGINRDFETITGQLTEYVDDLSNGGVFLRCDDPLPIGTRVELRFSILTDDIEIIEGIGEVVRHQGGARPGMGIRFVSLTDASRSTVDRACSKSEPG